MLFFICQHFIKKTGFLAKLWLSTLLNFSAQFKISMYMECNNWHTKALCCYWSGVCCMCINRKQIPGKLHLKASHLCSSTSVLTRTVILHIRGREWVFQRFSPCLLWLFASVTSIYFYGAVRNALLCVFVNVSMYVQGGVCMEYVFMHTSVHENVLGMRELVLTKFQSHFQGPRTSTIRAGSLEMILV